MKARDYCCCAVPLVNVGIYAVLLEQLVLGAVAGVLSMATPSIVGAATPSFAPWIFGIACFVAAGVQILGFIGVAKGGMTLFKRYGTLHLIATLVAFAIAGTWTILSVSKHNDAKSKCIKDFFSSDAALKSQGETLCTIFPFVDVGIMGGMWVFLAITHVYFYVLILAYPASKDSRTGYTAVGSSAALAPDTIPMSTRGDLYAAEGKTQDFSHYRKDSSASMSDVMNEPLRQPTDGFRQQSYDADPYYPRQAYTQDPGPTPGYNNQYFGDSSSLRRPGDAKFHPAEGSFRRKTPRLQKQAPYAFG